MFHSTHHTESSDRVLTFLWSVLCEGKKEENIKTSRCGVRLIIIYFPTAPPQDHLLIMRFISAAPPGGPLLISAASFKNNIKVLFALTLPPSFLHPHTLPSRA